MSHAVRSRLALLLGVLLLALAGCSSETGDTGAAAPADAGTAADDDGAVDEQPDGEQPEPDDGDGEVAAEGGGGSLVAAAVEASSGYTSARMRFSAVTATPDGDVEVTGEGTSDSATGAASMSMTMGGSAAAAFGTDEATIDVILVDGVMYQRFPLLLEQFGSDAEWFSIDLAGVVPGFETMLDQARQLDPSESLTHLRDMSDVTEVGRETINGFETTHYSGSTTMRAALEASGVDPETMGQDLQDAGMDLDAPVPVDVWIDDEGLVRRYETSVDAAGGTTTSTYEILEYGIEVDITPPPTDATVSFEELTAQAQGG